MPDLSSLTLDLTGRELVEESPHHRMWRDASGTFLKLNVTLGGPGWPFDLRDPDLAAEFYGRQCREQFKGVMLDMDVVNCAGHTALRGLFKYRSPVPGSMGLMFVYIVWLPFRDWTAQINVEAVERGTTGAREAAVMLLEGAPADKPKEEPVAVSSIEEMFQKMRERPLVALGADDPKYDDAFPEHPLSLVRRQMGVILGGLTVNEPPERCLPYCAQVASTPISTSAPANKKPRPWWKLW